MDLTYREMEPRDFGACREMLQDRAHYAPDAWEALPGIWRHWRDSGLLNAAVMEMREGAGAPEIVQFGVSVFVSETFMAEMRSTPPPRLGVHLIRCVLAGRSPLLDLAAIGKASGSGGLNSVVSHFGFTARAWTPEQNRLFVSRMPDSFLWLHEGYHFREMLQEYYDPQIVGFCQAAGFLRRECRLESPQWVGITREEAAANPGAYIAKLFPYSPPRFCFSAGEQSVLRHALLGRTDEECASLLCAALPTIKKRWVAIYDRVGGHLPELLPEAALSSADSLQKRGQEKRRLLLAYLRQHPEELRPFRA